MLATRLSWYHSSPAHVQLKTLTFVAHQLLRIVRYNGRPA
jgi:hypothetical protein